MYMCYMCTLYTLQDGNTALLHAAKEGHTICVCVGGGGGGLLSTPGINVNIKDRVS